ncbi:MAG: DUF4832 domain-containing protein [Balneolales bacterium]
MYNIHRYAATTILALITLVFFSSQHQNVTQNDGLATITYEPTDAIFPNPERGFYQWVAGTPTSPLLDLDKLRDYRAENRTLIFRPYLLSDFRESDISEEFLDRMRADFETLREAGLKTLFKFRYTNGIPDDVDPDPNTFDAPLERVLSHLDQLAPLFQEYYDVIAVAQAGFIGAWGEWHGSYYGLTTTTNMRTILFHFLDILPEDRMIQIRRPVYIWHIYNLGLYGDPLTKEEAYSGTNRSRTGHHNDCFMTNETNAGTYYGLDTLGQSTGRLDIEETKDFLNLNNRYVPMGGETCTPRDDVDFYGCEFSLEELARMRWSLLNHGFSRDILDVWVEQGCMPEVERRLGYRFALQEGSYTEQSRPGGIFRFNLQLENKGFAAPYNPRGLQVILRSVENSEEIWEVNLPDDPRFWMAGDTVNLSYELGLPNDLDGYYEVLLNLPDPADPIRHQPEFSIRLANTSNGHQIWEEDTGFNRLSHFINIDSSLPGEGYDGDLNFEPFGTWEGEPVSAEPDIRPHVPAATELRQNYPNPFNPVTTITFDLQQDVNVRLEVFNLLGQKVASLVDEPRTAGTHRVTFDSSELSSGVYLYMLTAGNITETRSMTVLR